MEVYQTIIRETLKAIEEGESFDYLDRIIVPRLRTALAMNFRCPNCESLERQNTELDAILSQMEKNEPLK